MQVVPRGQSILYYEVTKKAGDKHRPSHAAVRPFTKSADFLTGIWGLLNGNIRRMTNVASPVYKLNHSFDMSREGPKIDP